MYKYKEKSMLIPKTSVLALSALIGWFFVVNVSLAAPNKLSGRILLQVEKKGEAWYVNPIDQKRYFLGRPDDAFQLMRKLGLGVSENDYGKFKNNNEKAPANLAGKIILRVKSKGEAYYVNPLDLKMHYLGRPADAFRVMRNLGLGITDADLSKIVVKKGSAASQASADEAVEKPEVTKIPKETNAIVREPHTYVGSGTYDFGKGDVLIDDVNNKKFVFNSIRQQDENRWLVFDTYDLDTEALISKDAMVYLSPDKLYTGYEPMKLAYVFRQGKLPIYFLTFKGLNQDGTTKISFDFYLNEVLGDTAFDNKKILIVPVYFHDEYEVYDQFPLYRDTFLKPALGEIQAYLKTKQLEFMGQEIMTVDFTVADALKMGKINDYLFHEQTDHFDDRKAMIRNNSPYNPDDFNDIAFLFFTEEFPEKAYLNTAQSNQAVITFHQSPITDYELNTPIQVHQKRNMATIGLLHEMLHLFGMSDNFAWEIDAFDGKFYDGTQKFEAKRGDDTSPDSEWGMFQKINDQVASELGWCDENRNNIFDAKEFYANKASY